jgi:hypothetical protein
VAAAIDQNNPHRTCEQSIARSIRTLAELRMASGLIASFTLFDPLLAHHLAKVWTLVRGVGLFGLR